MAEVDFEAANKGRNNRQQCHCTKWLINEPVALKATVVTGHQVAVVILAGLFD